MIQIPCQILMEWLTFGEWDTRGIQHAWEKKTHAGLWWENLNPRNVLECPSVHENWSKEKDRESVNEIPLAPDKDHWPIYVNMVKNPQVPDKVGGLFTTRTMITLFGSTLPHELSELTIIQFQGHQMYKKGPLPIQYCASEYVWNLSV